MIQIAPSLLSANLLRLETEITAVVEAGADFIHLDVMDNHYVPNLTFGPDFCRAIRAIFPKLNIDVHLMVKPVTRLIEAFAKAGATRISIHQDACTHLDRALASIRELGCEAGLALNPAQSLDILTYTHHRLDFVLVMTVNPGFGGQKLIPACIDKVKSIKTQYPKLSIAVDGGVNLETAPALMKAGANTLIMGAALFGAKDYAGVIRKIKAIT